MRAMIGKTLIEISTGTTVVLIILTVIYRTFSVAVDRPWYSLLLTIGFFILMMPVGKFIIWLFRLRIKDKEE